MPGLADLSGDKALDIAVGDVTGNSVNVFLGNGNGTFQPMVAYSTGNTNPSGLGAGDLTGDGKPELLAPCGNASSLYVFINNGNGTFQGKVGYGASSADSAAAGDFNGDKKIDVAFATVSGSVGVMLGNGDGSLQAAAYIQTSQNEQWVTARDLDGDSKVDLVVTNRGPDNISVLIGNGNGTFQQPVTYATAGMSPYDSVAADFNLDGTLDLAVLDSAVSVFLGKGAGAFQQAMAFPVGGFSPSGMAVGDFNGDGKPDIAVTNYNGNSISVLLNTSK